MQEPSTYVLHISLELSVCSPVCPYVILLKNQTQKVFQSENVVAQNGCLQVYKINLGVNINRVRHEGVVRYQNFYAYIC